MQCGVTATLFYSVNLAFCRIHSIMQWHFVFLYCSWIRGESVDCTFNAKFFAACTHSNTCYTNLTWSNVCELQACACGGSKLWINVLMPDWTVQHLDRNYTLKWKKAGRLCVPRIVNENHGFRIINRILPSGTFNNPIEKKIKHFLGWQSTFLITCCVVK